MTKKERLKRYNKFLELRKQKKTFREIGDMYGITRQAVQSFLKRGKPKRYSKKKRIVDSNKFSGREYVRQIVRLRDDNTCQKCYRRWRKEERRFDVHHLNGLCGKRSRSYDRLEDMVGLITLCHKCHMSLHSTRIKMKRGQKKLSTPLFIFY